MAQSKEVSTAELKSSIKDILKDADLDSLSAKKVRKMLESKFDADFTDRKQEIDKMVMDQISESQNTEEEDEEDGSAANGTTDSDSDDEVLDAEPVRKKKKVSKNGDDNDEELAKKLQDEELSRTRGGGRKSKAKAKSEKPKKEKKDRKGTSMYSKKCQLSPELAAIMGEDQLARSDVVKKMWAIARERNLQDPKNKQFMLCDDQLKKVFGRKRVRMFGMMKDLKPHILDVKDLV
ncbi:hypothetical protein LOTGIDRAFT_235351 [Lottia gigantea]|uniref:Uncharacterized protein n=1 Tax=Lottia gigantea TaxID=225164 RepID=V4BDG4_LOTGI|nr:hypothetical protein LOTGIDRAFT_235351 [Lottia gigantea]ESO86554.1 hypothetical protein LOTGIDRAFT_235351 [Lottia gigantea]